MSTAIFRFSTALEAAVACGDATLELLEAAKRSRGVAMLAISGGSTPRLMFESMATRGFDWNSVEIFWVDERMVPPDDALSNYRMTREAMLDAIHPQPAQVHRILGELSPADAAAQYISEIRRVFGLSGSALPVFDVIQRGMGPDMHTASLFPGEALIGNETDIAAAVFAPQLNQHRVTLLPGVLRRARQTLCLVTGADKAPGLKQVLNNPPDPIKRPAQIASGQMAWYVDQAASPGRS